MKKLIILILAIAPFFSSCNKDNETSPNDLIREIAWNSLSENEKSTVTIDWRDAPVLETIYEEQAAYSVTFNTSDDPLLGPIIVYVDTTSEVVLGYGLRM